MIDFATLELAAAPNQYLVCSAEICRAAAANRPSPVFSVPAAAVKEAWLRVLSNEPRVKLLESDEPHLQFEFVQRTAVFRFPDRITVRFVPLADGHSTLAVYSRSIYGWSDLGTNRRRIERWLTLLEDALEGGNAPRP